MDRGNVSRVQSVAGTETGQHRRVMENEMTGEPECQFLRQPDAPIALTGMSFRIVHTKHQRDAVSYR